MNIPHSILTSHFFFCFSILHSAFCVLHSGFSPQNVALSHTAHPPTTPPQRPPDTCGRPLLFPTPRPSTRVPRARGSTTRRPFARGRRRRGRGRRCRLRPG